MVFSSIFIHQKNNCQSAVDTLIHINFSGTHIYIYNILLLPWGLYPAILKHTGSLIFSLTKTSPRKWIEIRDQLCGSNVQKIREPIPGSDLSQTCSTQKIPGLWIFIPIGSMGRLYKQTDSCSIKLNQM